MGPAKMGRGQGWIYTGELVFQVITVLGFAAPLPLSACPWDMGTSPPRTERRTRPVGISQVMVSQVAAFNGPWMI